MDNFKFKETLKFVVDKLNDSGVEWFLIGGFNQQVQGLNREAKDIDIGIRIDDLEKVKKLFGEFEIFGEGETFDKKGKKFKFKLNNSEIDINAFEKDSAHFLKLKGDNKIKKINFLELELNCYPIELEADIYEEFGRKERAEQIREVLK